MPKTRLNKQFDRHFGSYVKKKRESKGWTQVDLAERMDNNFQNISRMERGELTPTAFWCYRLATVFDMDLAQLFREVGFRK